MILRVSVENRAHILAYTYSRKVRGDRRIYILTRR